MLNERRANVRLKSRKRFWQFALKRLDDHICFYMEFVTIEVQVPEYLENEDAIKVNTESGKFMSRV